jgi:hypothetical protein
MGKRGRPYHRIHQVPFRRGGNRFEPKRQEALALGNRSLKDWALLIGFWGYVLLPLAWGVSATVQKALLLFRN